MFSKGLQRVLPYFYSTHEGFEQNLSYGSLSMTMLAISWLSWYVWRFGIGPVLSPNEPKQMPYWIPMIGHAISFFRDSEGLFTKSRRYFGDTREPFALTVAGKRLYIVTSQQDVSAVYRNATTLMFDDFVRDMMLSIGASEDGVRKVWASPDTGRSRDSSDSNEHHLHKALAHAGDDFYRQQFQPGERLDELWPRIQSLISSSLLWESIPSECVISTAHETKSLSLLRWCRETLLMSVSTAVFGEKLLELEPRLMQIFVAFDDDSWKLNYKFPRSMAKDM